MNSTNRIVGRSGRQHDNLALEARLAACLAAALTQRAEIAPYDVTERLRVAREQAVGRARVVRASRPVAAVAGNAVLVGNVGTGALLGRGGEPFWWQRAASALPIFVVVLGLVLISQASVREQVLAAAEIDSQLLADDLPPDAYSDPGFAEFLRTDASAAP